MAVLPERVLAMMVRRTDWRPETRRSTRSARVCEHTRTGGVGRTRWSIQRWIVVNQPAEQGKNGFRLAGLAQVGHASQTFGLFTAARIVERRDDDHRNRRPLVPQPALQVQA